MRLMPIAVLGIGFVGALVIQRSRVDSAQSMNQRGPREMPRNRDGRHYSASGYDVTPLSDERIKELAARLEPEERYILLEHGTERAFSGALLKVKDSGVYACRLCGLPLFSSDAKFKSGTGWPSFFKPFDPDHVLTNKDASLGMVRNENRCARCGSHLGHVFDDGPQPTGLRYCMNSGALRFHDRDAELPAASRPVTTETAYFAGGCFWGIEDAFQQVPGVVDAVSGYQGGSVPDPSYKQVCRGDTGHAETVRVTFDPAGVTYERLLEWFFKLHDPTQRDRQGPDVGSQYRSAIFASNDDQLAAAKAHVDKLGRSGRFGGREIVTTVEKAGPFFDADEYHQDYHAKHGGSCALPRDE